MENCSFVLKGDICWSETPKRISTMEQGYLVCVDGICRGVHRQLPAEFIGLPVRDWGRKLITPGLVDLHIHAPQYAYRGTGMDLELLEWLNRYAFPEEARYEDLDYARRAYGIFAKAMRGSATTRACIFATVHEEATGILTDLMEATGLVSLVGKVNMDRNAPDYLEEESAGRSVESTVSWIRNTGTGYSHVRPILTPRFIPSCSDELMRGLGEIRKRYELPVQSHLSENLSEVDWVRELCPQSRFYGDAYDRFGLFGGRGCPTIMAHCVYSDQEERALMKERGVFLAHCPESNMNIASGIAPVRTWLEEGLRVGLGSDVAGGTTESMFHAMAVAIQVSKLRWRLTDQSLAPLTAAEAFYLATKGGGGFFGRVGSFEEGYEMDAVVLDDEDLCELRTPEVEMRLERLIYLDDGRRVAGKYVQGRKVV